MGTATETSDARVIDLLRTGAKSVSEIAEATDVTATAVRQRLNRLMSQGLVGREATRAGRGRPSHRYLLTDKARRQVGNNYGDLALMLWDEIRSVKDPGLRQGLLRRVAMSLARLYAGRVAGSSVVARMEAVKEVFAERRVPLAVTGGGDAPVLTVLDCPYPELAEKDRSICAVEKMLFAELLAAPMKLTQCRLEGHSCCQFQAVGGGQ
jgi:DeoR family transcriptional regulator, suf operon transcriptional repressor